MTSSQPVIFCLPPQCTPNNAQQKEAAYGIIDPRLQYTVFYNWIYQTWHHLTQAGIPCKLSNQIPDEGIVVTLGRALPSTFKKAADYKNFFLVSVVADTKSCPYANLHVVQNKKQIRLIKNSLYLPHWPQPHLISRDPNRHDRFENVCYIGDPRNLAPELHTQKWQERLKNELGLIFTIKKLSDWHDCSDVDCIIAIRDFSKSPHYNKPATKLYNAWLGGIPFIGGSDSAYAADGHPGKDYLVATSPEEAFHSLRRLKENKSLRNSLVEKGKKSALKFTQQATLECWKKLVLETLPMLAKKHHE